MPNGIRKDGLIFKRTYPIAIKKLQRARMLLKKLNLLKNLLHPEINLILRIGESLIQHHYNRHFGINAQSLLNCLLNIPVLMLILLQDASSPDYRITPWERMMYQLIPCYFEIPAGHHNYASWRYNETNERKIRERYASLTSLQKLLMVYDAYGFETAQLINKQLPASEQLSTWQLSSIKNQTLEQRKATLWGIQSQSTDKCVIS